jgi:hypothetical protein
MTGYSGVLTAEKVRQLGFRELLNKPISLRTLGETVHGVLHPTASDPTTSPVPSDQRAAPTRPIEVVKTALANPATPQKKAPSEALIAQKAYELWLAQGRESGCDEKYWFAAKLQLQSI